MRIVICRMHRRHHATADPSPCDLYMQPFARGYTGTAFDTAGPGGNWELGCVESAGQMAHPTRTLGDFTHRRMQLVQHAVSMSCSKMPPSLPTRRGPVTAQGCINSISIPRKSITSICQLHGLPREEPDRQAREEVYIKGSATRLLDQ